jgi:hypothetical protein
MRIEIIPPNLRNGSMMHHLILDGMIPQTKHLSVCFKIDGTKPFCSSTLDVWLDFR